MIGSFVNLYRPEGTSRKTGFETASSHFLRQFVPGVDFVLACSTIE
jgi:hypothetical protein